MNFVSTVLSLLRINYYLTTELPLYVFFKLYPASLSLKLLMEILQAAETDKEGSAAAAYMTEAQREEKLSRLRNDREKWKEEILAAAAGLPPESEMTEVCFSLFLVQPTSNVNILCGKRKESWQVLLDYLPGGLRIN